MALGLGLVDLLEKEISGKESLARGYDTNSVFSRCGWIDPLNNVEALSESGLPWDAAPWQPTFSHLMVILEVGSFSEYKISERRQMP
jgi:hypothetical protein